MKTKQIINPVRIPDNILQEQADNILEHDKVFIENARQLRTQATSGVISRQTFKQIFYWQVAACFRRVGLARREAQLLLKVVAL